MKRKTFLKILGGSIVLPFMSISKILGSEEPLEIPTSLEPSTISTGMRKPIHADDGDLYIDTDNMLWIYFDGWKRCTVEMEIEQ